ncbi:MAG: hypothetical protein SWN10_23930 [Pseudomonadota bacterium]|nr:hypothetical protein [Pseudomonadota bacterium]
MAEFRALHSVRQDKPEVAMGVAIESMEGDSELYSEDDIREYWRAFAPT